MSIHCKNVHKTEYVLGHLFIISHLRAEFMATFKKQH